MKAEMSQTGLLIPPRGGKEVCPIPPGPPLTRHVNFSAWVPHILLAFLLGTIYCHIFIRLVLDWYTLPDFSHGFLVPVFAGLLLWEKRAAIRRVPPGSSWYGLAFVVVGIVVLLTGIYGAELFLSRVSFVLLLAGIVLTLFGWAMVQE